MKKAHYQLLILILSGPVFWGGASVFAAVTVHDFSRYQVILDKKPFGEVTPSEDAQPPAALSEIIIKEIELKAIVDDGSGIRIGLLDKKTNKNFSLGMGESHEGLQLVSVNYDNEEAVVKKDGETAVIKLRPDKGKEMAAVPAAVPTGLSELPFQLPVTSSVTRRPFFSDLKNRRTNPFQPVGTNVLPFQAKSADSFFKVSTGAFPRVQSPFSPFQAPQGGAAPGGFQQITPAASNVPNPFMPISPAGGQVSPPNPNAPVDSKGATIDQLLQWQAGGEGQAQPAVIQFPAEEIAQ